MSDPQVARAKVTQALHEAIDAGDGFEEGDFVATWVAVIHIASIERPDVSTYYLMTPEAEGAPVHVVRGLLHEGLAAPTLDPEG